MAASPLDQLTNTLDEYLGKKAPQLPDNIKQTLVNFSPWLALIAGVLGVLSALTVFGIGSVFSPFALYGGPKFAGSYFSLFTFSSILLGVTGVLNLMAITPLRAKKERGWNLLFYAELIWIASYLIQFDLVNVVVGGLIGLYFLFQVRPYFK